MEFFKMFFTNEDAFYRETGFNLGVLVAGSAITEDQSNYDLTN